MQIVISKVCDIYVYMYIYFSKYRILSVLKTTRIDKQTPGWIRVDIFYRNKKSGLVIKRKRKIGWQSESTDSPLTLVVDGNIHTPTVRRNAFM